MIAYDLAGAAEQLSVSVRFFRDSILPEIRHSRVGRRYIIPHAELQRWVAARSI